MVQFGIMNGLEYGHPGTMDNPVRHDNYLETQLAENGCRCSDALALGRYSAHAIYSITLNETHEQNVVSLKFFLKKN